MITTDRKSETPKQRAAFESVRNAERGYARQLRQIARHVGQIIKSFSHGGVVNTEEVYRYLTRYAELIRPWAHSAGKRMIAEVNRRDDRAWATYARTMGIETRKILEGPIGNDLRGFLDTQVDLITSLPREAAQRVHDITVGNLYENLRGKALFQEIMRTGEVTESRATLIARTETARTATAMTMVRASRIGSTQYVWRTSKDRRVRESHRKMEGRVCDWANPPEVEPGMHYHAGMVWNCRCFPEPIIPQDLD